MESKTSFFNKTIFSKTWKRFFPWCICYSLILLVAIPILTLINYPGFQYGDQPYRTTEMLYQAQTDSQFVIIAIFAAAVLSAMLIFSFLYKNNAVSMFHSLPVKRSTHLFTSFLAGLTLLLLPLILAQGSTILISLCIGEPQLALFHLKLLGGYGALTFIFFTIAVFSAMLAGNTVAVPVIYGIIHCLSYGVLLLLNVFIQYFLFGIEGVNFDLLYKFSPIGYFYESLTRIQATDTLTKASQISLNVSGLFWYAVVALILLLLSLILYKKRSLECAGDILAYKKTSILFQILFAAGTGLIGMALTTQFFDNGSVSTVILILSFVIGSVFGFLGSRMLIFKRFFVFKESFVPFVIYGICAVGLMIFINLDLFGFENKIPEIEDIASISVDYMDEITDEGFFKDVTSLHKQILQNKKYIQSHQNDYKNARWMSMTYQLKNGKTLSRVYCVPFTEESINDISSMIYKYYTITNNPLLVKAEFLCKDFQPDDLIHMDFVDYGTGESTEIPLENARLIVDALEKDIAEGHVLRDLYYSDTEAEGSSPYLECNHVQSQQVLELYIKDESENSDLYDVTSSAMYYETDVEYSSNRYIYLKSTMTHTLEVLDELGYVTEEKPLTYEADMEE